METVKKEQTGKRKENNNTRKSVIQTERKTERKTQIQQNRKINENEARKGAAKRQKNKHVRKMNFHDNLHK